MPRMKTDSAKKVGKNLKREPPQEVAVENSESVPSDEGSFKMANSPEVFEDKKNNLEFDDGYQQDFSGEMSKLLGKFSTDMNKTMQAKRRKLEQFTQESTRSTTKKVLENNKNQSMERRKLIEHFQNQFNTMLAEGEKDLEKIKEAEDRMQKLLIQQQKHQQQVRISYSQQMKALKNLSAEFCKGMDELEECHVQQYSSVHNELRKEMAMMQKKILMETQQQEMMNVRKHLKQMLA